MTGDLDSVPGAQVGKDLASGFLDLLFDQGNLFLETDAQGMSFRVLSELLEFVLQFNDRLFEIEMMFHPEAGK